LPARIKAKKIVGVTQSVDDLEARSILLDGDAGGYLLQAFCREQSVQFDRSNAGPMFLEMVQRCGSKGFGEGNFRALFEAMAQQGGGGASALPFADD
jgi:4-hydroxyphenylpyruvate dioxygenase